MTDLDLIPVLCQSALHERLTPKRMRNSLAGAHQALAQRRKSLEAMHRRWSRQSLTRAELEALREAVLEGGRELEGLERCLRHLHTWSRGGGAACLRSAMAAYETAQGCWRRHVRYVMALAPEMTCREYYG